MNTSEKLGLNLPEQSDRFDIDDLNENSEKLDGAIVADSSGRVDMSGDTVVLYSPDGSEESRQNPTQALINAENGNLKLRRTNIPRGSSANHIYVELDDDRIVLSVSGSDLEVTADGVTFNGKSLGGSGFSIGGVTGITSGISNSAIGALVEEET